VSLNHISRLHFSPDVTDSAPQIGCHKGFSEGVEYRAYWPLKNILCGIKDQAGSVASGEKCRLDTMIELANQFNHGV